MNTTLSTAFRVSKKFNQYLFLELYNGTGDSLLEYKTYDLKLRIVMCIKPDFFSMFKCARLMNYLKLKIYENCGFYKKQ